MQCLMYGLVMVTVKGVVIALMTFNIWKTVSLRSSTLMICYLNL